MTDAAAAGEGLPPDHRVDFPVDRAKLFSRAPAKIFVGHIGAASALIYLASDVLAVQWLVLWGLWEILVTPTLLYVLGKQAENCETSGLDLNLWQRRLYGLFLAIGVSWGLFVFFGLDVDNPAHFSIQMAIVAGASAAASRSLSIFKLSFYLYEIPFAGLLAIRVFMLGGDYVLLAGLVLIFIAMMCGLARDTSEELSDYLATKLENLDLAKKFEAAALDAQRANAAKTQFLAQANHDLRQPIHAIGLLSACLRDQKLDNDGREILDTIDISVENLSNLFKSLLNITSLDAGALKPEQTRFPLTQVLEETVRQALPTAEQNGSVIKVVDTSVWVETDKALLASIVQNLVFNAVKYAPGSRILVGARMTGGKATIHVLDQGAGVPDSQQERIFEEFVRGNPDGPNRTDGLGLGLSIVKRTATLLGLHVGFSSREGAGTHVRVSGLPCVQSVAEAVQRTAEVSDQKLRGTTVLVIDDDDCVRASVDRLLRKWGYRPIVQGPTDPMPEDFDLLLMDYHLNTDRDGIALAKSLLGQRQDAVPTAIVSGTMTVQLQERARADGFWVLQKPVTPLQLRSLLISMDVSRRKATEQTAPEPADA